MTEPQRPHAFSPGDMVVVVETEWPPGSGIVNEQTGLYDRPGFPRIAPDTPQTTLDEQIAVKRMLNEKRVGIAHVGDRCLVLGTLLCEDDAKWYYLLNSGKAGGMGWTRCGYRLRKV